MTYDHFLVALKA